MQKTYDKIKVRFPLLQSRYWSSLGALTWLEELKNCLLILNKLHSDVLSYI